MADLAIRVEITKLAAELRVDEGDLGFLASRQPAEVRELRRHIAEALFTRHEDQLLRIASASKLLPVGITAKIAQHAMGAMLSARVAGVMEPREAAKLAEHFDPEFLTDVSESLDPKRVAAIVAALPESLVIDVGRRLMERKQHIVLGRFVAVVDAHVTAAVAAGAAAEDLLQVALYADDTSAFEAIVERLPAPVLTDLLRRADEVGAWDVLGPESRQRLVAALSEG